MTPLEIIVTILVGFGMKLALDERKTFKNYENYYG